MTESSRREFLTAAGAGMALPWTVPDRPRAMPAAKDPAAVAAALREAPHDSVLEVALDLHRRGAGWRALLGGAFLAGVEDVLPHPVGFQYHCVMMTSSAFRVALAAPQPERLMVALFNVDDFARAAARDRQSADWEMPPAPAVEAGDAERAVADFAAAMEAWDEEAADRAAVALARSMPLDRAFDSIWGFGARDFTNIGHKPICVTQCYRTLQEIGWQHGEPVVRSIARGLLHGEPGRHDVSWAPNLERARELGPPAPGDAVPERSFEVLAALRDATPEDAAGAVAAMWREGSSPATLADGLRLVAGELLLRAPWILAVHAVTSLNALLWTAGRTTDPAVARAAMLQAAGWLAEFRDAAAGRGGYDADRPRIDALEASDEEPAAAAEAAFRADTGRDAAEAAALRAGSGGAMGALAARARGAVARCVRGHHDYKFVEALLEEASLARPTVGARLLAAGVPLLPHADGAEASYRQQVAERRRR